MLIDDISKNRNLAKKLVGNSEYRISVLSNIVLNQLKYPLEVILQENNINAQVKFGDYDNIVQDSGTLGTSHAVVVVWEACNLIDGLHYKSLSWTNETVQSFVEKTKLEIALVFKNLDHVPVIIFNKFSSILFTHELPMAGNFDKICTELNTFVESIKPRNCYFLSIENIVCGMGVGQAFNRRMWHSSRMLYTYEFLSIFACRASIFILSVSGKAKKALVLDCDNTLWKGIIGEDGIEGISLNHHKKDGIFFEEVHYLLKILMNQGIILVLNSKNNERDVQQVFDSNPQLPLVWNDFVIKKVNWKDKVSNLKEIATELNIGVDSLVHMDDSDFEINFIKQELPEVQTIQVPSYLPDYPIIFRKRMSLFFNLNSTKEDTGRIEMYKDQLLREEDKNKFSDIEEYLQSLQLEITVHLNDTNEIARIAQMTQKTNQFNLTTIRQTETEIEQEMKDGNHFIFSFSLKDKFGDYGITGLCIINKENDDTAYIDTLLMSCRIIGRNIEFVFFDFLVAFLLKNGITNLTSKYIKSFKNQQVESLFDKFGMNLQSNEGTAKTYHLILNNYITSNIKYIKINYGKPD